MCSKMSEKIQPTYFRWSEDRWSKNHGQNCNLTDTPLRLLWSHFQFLVYKKKYKLSPVHRCVMIGEWAREQQSLPMDHIGYGAEMVPVYHSAQLRCLRNWHFSTRSLLLQSRFHSWDLLSRYSVRQLRKNIILARDLSYISLYFLSLLWITPFPGASCWFRP